MDINRYILINLTFMHQENIKAVLHSRRPDPESARRISGRTEAALRSYSVIIIICDYV